MLDVVSGGRECGVAWGWMGRPESMCYVKSVSYLCHVFVNRFRKVPMIFVSWVHMAGLSLNIPNPL